VLCLAGRPEVSGALRFVVAVGGFHDLPALLDWHAAREGFTPRSEIEWDDAIYFRLWLAIALQAELGVAPEVAAKMESLLERFCDESSAAEKRAFFEQHLRPLPIARVLREQDRAPLAAVSPRGQLAQAGCPVTLIHDRLDGVVPLGEAERAHAELCTSAGGERHRLVVTEVLSQLTPARALDLPALARLAAALEPLVASASG
jgi:pimeloyl-ACP methyl ester carboxylesterase